MTQKRTRRFHPEILSGLGCGTIRPNVIGLTKQDRLENKPPKKKRKEKHLKESRGTKSGKGRTRKSLEKSIRRRRIRNKEKDLKAHQRTQIIIITIYKVRKMVCLRELRMRYVLD